MPGPKRSVNSRLQNPPRSPAKVDPNNSCSSEMKINVTAKRSVNSRLQRPPRPPAKVDQNNCVSKIKIDNNLPSHVEISAKEKNFSTSTPVQQKINQNTSSKDTIKISNEGDVVFANVNKKFDSKAKRSLKFTLNNMEVDESNLEQKKIKKSVNDRLIRPVKPPRSSNSIDLVGEALSAISLPMEKEKSRSLNSQPNYCLGSSVSSDGEGLKSPQRRNGYKWIRETNGKSEDVIDNPGRFNREQSHPDCICFRLLKRVMCKVCGSLLIGRIRQICKVHPRDVYLLDVSDCAICKLPNGLMEYSIPEGAYPKDKINRKIDE